MREPMSNAERKQAIKALEEEISKLKQELFNLKENCTHEITKNRDSARCTICGSDQGWWCPKSPDHTCDYEQEDGEFDEDSCRYCGQPEERK